MNLFEGQIEEISSEDGIRVAKVHVYGVLVRTSLMFLPNVNIGDSVLVEAGVGISKIENNSRDQQHVPCNSG